MFSKWLTTKSGNLEPAGGQDMMAWQLASGKHGRRAPQTPGSPLPGEADEAWKVLEIVNDSIRRAETKSSIIMAAAGAIGGVLYNIAETRVRQETAFDASAAFCGIAALAAVIFAGFALIPHLRPHDNPDSLIYFHHVSRRYNGDEGSAEYRRLLKLLVADKDRLVDGISAQIWANAQVARQKYQMNKAGLIAILFSTVALAATGAITVGCLR